MIFKKTQLFLIIGLIALVFIVALVATFQGGGVQNLPPSASPKPTSIQRPLSDIPSISEYKPILINEVPTKPQSEGGGVNLESQLVQESQREIAKILPQLPYQNSFIGGSGKTVSILIPSSQFQTTPWVIDVQIYGVNYQLPESDPNYNNERSAFLNAAANIFEWVKAQGADPEKIIFNWGDRAYIREQTQKWLNQ